MNRKTSHKEWKHLAARLILAGASVGGLSALAGCDQSGIAQFAGIVMSGNGALDVPTLATVDPFKADSSGRLASNHNETFLVA